MATYTQGTDGRVKSGANTVAGITMWRRTGTVTPIPIPHFESSASSGTSTVTPAILKGLGENKVMVEGLYDIDATTKTETGTPGLAFGASVTLDLFISKASTVGYDGVAGLVTEFSVGQQIDNQACKFSMTVTVNGVFPEYGAIT